MQMSLDPCSSRVSHDCNSSTSFVYVKQSVSQLEINSLFWSNCLKIKLCLKKTFGPLSLILSCQHFRAALWNKTLQNRNKMVSSGLVCELISDSFAKSLYCCGSELKTSGVQYLLHSLWSGQSRRLLWHVLWGCKQRRSFCNPLMFNRILQHGLINIP